MTAILAIEFPYQIIAIADARVSWKRGKYRPQDNLQKIYPLGPTGIVGFSGSIAAAKAIFRDLESEKNRRPLPTSAEEIPRDLGNVARESFAKLRGPSRDEIHLMYACVDYSKIGLVAENMIMAKNVMSVMSSPDFDVRESPEAIRLGYAVRYPLDLILKNRNGLMRHGTSQMGKRFQVAIAINAFAPALAHYAPEQVGGLFTVGVATAEGVGWWPYGSGDDYEMLIEEGRFIQIDHRKEKRIPLKRITEFRPYAPSPGDLRIDTPQA